MSDGPTKTLLQIGKIAADLFPSSGSSFRHVEIELCSRFVSGYGSGRLILRKKRFSVGHVHAAGESRRHSISSRDPYHNRAAHHSVSRFCRVTPILDGDYNHRSCIPFRGIRLQADLASRNGGPFELHRSRHLKTGRTIGPSAASPEQTAQTKNADCESDTVTHG